MGRERIAGYVLSFHVTVGGVGGRQCPESRPSKVPQIDTTLLDIRVPNW